MRTVTAAEVKSCWWADSVHITVLEPLLFSPINLTAGTDGPLALAVFGQTVGVFERRGVVWPAAVNDSAVNSGFDQHKSAAFTHERLQLKGATRNGATKQEGLSLPSSSASILY